ncbi:MAG TPA: c-type cytochrome biogenesis protein CcmI [Pseudolabrys sp.]|nr:c-type cytochrome biogenesis protein CcmI [Pseudolabrys sp.]
MTLWFVVALMTAAAVFAVLWPLSRAGGTRSGSDLAVYRDQLEEIERDRTAGLIGQAEADAARVEVSRRLIAAADAADAVKSLPDADTKGVRSRRIMAVIALLLLPAGAGALYLMLGSPDLPGAPLSARRQPLQENRSIESLIAQAEAQIERHPNDGRGWEVLAPIYLRLGRFDDAVKARRRSLELNGETPERQADLGEALVAAANGIVTAEAKAAFDKALASDPAELKSRFYVGMAAEQDGRRDEAAKIWQGMLDGAPRDAPWVPAVRQALAHIGITAEGSADAKAAEPGPSAGDVAAASSMSPAEREQMVRGMVARLAEKLQQDGSDVDGWLRLIRAYVVLGDRDKANAAASDARRALGTDADKLRRVEDLIKSMGLTG